MRLAYVSADPGIPFEGMKGASVHVRALSTAFERLGHEVHVFAPTRNGGGVHGGRRLVPLPPAGEDRLRLLHAMLLNRVLEASAEAPFDLVYERYSLGSRVGLLTARASGAPLLLEVNAPLIEEAERHRGFTRVEDARLEEEALFRGSRRVIAVSEPVREYVLARGVDARAVIVAPNGVDLARFDPACARDHAQLLRERWGVGPAELVVGFVGSLRPWHAVGDLFSAIFDPPGVPNARLVVVGEGPGLAPLMERARALPGGRVVFASAVPQEAVPGHLAAMDVAVAPYPPDAGDYFSPLKILEYAAMARPIVASAIGGIPRWIRDGATGLLVPPGDPASLRGAILRLEENPVLREALGRAARAEIALPRDWTEVAREVLDGIAAGDGTAPRRGSARTPESQGR